MHIQPGYRREKVWKWADVVEIGRHCCMPHSCSPVKLSPFHSLSCLANNIARIVQLLLMLESSIHSGKSLTWMPSLACTL